MPEWPPEIAAAVRECRTIALPLHGLASDVRVSASASLIAFDVARFDPGSFGAVGVGRPASVGASARKRQCEFLFGRLAARLAWAGQGGASIEVGIGPAGAPV